MKKPKEAKKLEKTEGEDSHPLLKIVKKIDPRSVGRPTLYDPKYIEQVLKLGTEGMSLVEIAATLNVSRANLYDWAQRNPEFSSALTRAREESQAYWERVGRLGVFKGEYEIDSNLWYRNITNRFKADWAMPKDKEPETGDMIEVKPVAIDADKLDPEKRELLKSLLLELKEIGEAENEQA